MNAVAVNQRASGERVKCETDRTDRSDSTVTPVSPEQGSVVQVRSEHDQGGRKGACIGSVAEAVKKATPKTRQSLGRAICRLAGCVRAFEETTGHGLAPAELRAVVKDRFIGAHPFLSEATSADECYLALLDVIEQCKPTWELAVDRAWRKSATAPTPPEAIADGITDPNMVRLYAFLREFQLAVGDTDLGLSPYVLARLFKLSSHSSPCRWLGGMVNLRRLRKVAERKGIKASQYRFVFNASDPLAL